MKTFETIMVLNPDEITETINKAINKFTTLFQSYTKGRKICVDDMGVKNLAYEIRNHKKGYYVLFTWQGTSENVTESERLMRINSCVIKFMTIHAPEAASKLKDIQEDVQSEQMQEGQPDALDVLLGFANYTKKGGR